MKNAVGIIALSLTGLGPTLNGPRPGRDARLGANRGLTAWLEVLVFQDFRRGVIAKEWGDHREPWKFGGRVRDRTGNPCLQAAAETLGGSSRLYLCFAPRFCAVFGGYCCHFVPTSDERRNIHRVAT